MKKITTPLMSALFLGIVVSKSLAASDEAAFKKLTRENVYVDDE